jgi:hypothetical protein
MVLPRDLGVYCCFIAAAMRWLGGSSENSLIGGDR